MVIFESMLAFVSDPQKMLFVIGSLLLSIAALLGWKKLNRPSLLYAHLFFVVAPFFYFALSINCSFGALTGILSWCTALAAKFMIYIVPLCMAFVFTIGTAVIPYLLKRSAKKLTMSTGNDLCKKTKIEAQFYILKSSVPKAFAQGRNVFISVGMFECLSKKEVEAVMLHELHHVKSRASWNKFSAFFARIFSPLAWFSNASVEKEEQMADAFAIKIQGTAKHLKSAKNKLPV